MSPIHCWVLLAFAVAVHQSSAQCEEKMVLDFNATETPLLLALDTTTALACVIQGSPTWIINGTPVDLNNIQLWQNKSFHVNYTQSDGNNCPCTAKCYLMLLRIPAKKENNMTTVSCAADVTERSEEILIVIAGPPMSPVPVLEAMNATTARITWETPFTWEQFPILHYIISITNSTATSKLRVNATANSVLLSTGEDHRECVEYKLAIGAVSAVGESLNPSSIKVGFPVGPGEFAYPLSVDVIYGNFSSPKVKVNCTLPRLCSYQPANYTIAIRPDGETEGTITVGPFPYNTSQTGPVESEVAGLEVNKVYSVTVTLLTSTGTANSTAYFDTFVNLFTPDSSGASRENELPLIAGVVGSVALLFLLGIVTFIFTCILCITGKRNTQCHPPRIPDMIDNPIYEGSFYETIDARSLPNAVQNRSRENTYFGNPSHPSTEAHEYSTVATSPATEYKYENVYLEVPVANAATNLYDNIVPVGLTREEGNRMVSKYENMHPEVPAEMSLYDTPTDVSREVMGSTSTVDDAYTVMSPAAPCFTHPQLQLPITAIDDTEDNRSKSSTGAN